MISLKMGKKFKTGLILTLLFTPILVGAFFVGKFGIQPKDEPMALKINEEKKEIQRKQEFIGSEFKELTEKTGKQVNKKLRAEEIAESVSLEVPFTSQAPHSNWNMPWQEACEEAALMMVHHYLLGHGDVMDKNAANLEILKMVDWQIKNWGGHFDLSASEIARLAEEYYGHKNVKVKYDVRVKDIKRELSQGNPVIVPAAGRLLANPYFTPPGPVYHNLVIVGYDENGFITNDPGVWQGHRFRYSYENLLDSVHDFVDGTTKANPHPILSGKKAMIIIEN